MVIRSLRRSSAVVAAFGAASLLGAPGACASALPVTGNLVLAGTSDVPLGASGTGFAPGDVNGDGRADAALSFTDRTEIYLAGAGTEPLGPGSASRLIVIAHGPGERDTPAGDVNGDGRDDIVTVRCTASATGDAVLRTLPAGPGTVSLADESPPIARFGLPNLPAGGCVSRVVPIGDHDADGFDDLLLEWTPPQPWTDAEEGLRRTVVFGGDSLPAVVDLVAPGGLGYRLRGKAPGSPYFTPTPAGWNGSWTAGQGWDFADVEPAGDVNGDGKADFALLRGDEKGPTYMFIVLGSSARSDLLMTLRAGRAIRVGPVSPIGQIGPLGDFSGDGLADLAVTVDDVNRSRVIRGRRSTSDLGMSTGFQSIDGQIDSAAPAGDVNGDGLRDAAVALRYEPGSRRPARAAVLFGRTTTAAITVPNPGAVFATGLNLSVPAVPLGGDWNGDGRSDLYLPGGGVTFGYGPGAVPETVDTTAPVLSDVTIGAGIWNYCSIVFLKSTVVGVLRYSITEAATLEFSVRHRGVTRTATVVVPAGSTSAQPPGSLIGAGNGLAVVTVTPVDASGNRGAPTTVQMNVSQTGWNRSCSV